MYQLIHNLTLNELFKRQIPTFVSAFAIAEIFYKFHSFALECVAFLVTWYVFDAIGSRLFSKQERGVFRPERSTR